MKLTETQLKNYIYEKVSNEIGVLAADRNTNPIWQLYDPTKAFGNQNSQKNSQEYSLYTPEYLNQVKAKKNTPAQTPNSLSNEMLQRICRWETGKNFGYQMGQNDLNGYYGHEALAKGHKTFGYGLLTHPTMNKFMDQVKPRYTQQELEQLYIQSTAKKVNQVRQWAENKGITLNQNQLDSIVSACYNFGMGFLHNSKGDTQIGSLIANNPNDERIYNLWYHRSDSQGKSAPGLLKRRAGEANWYFGKPMA